MGMVLGTKSVNGFWTLIRKELWLATTGLPSYKHLWNSYYGLEIAVDVFYY